MKGRYGSLDITFAAHYDASTRSVELTPHTFQVGDRQFVGPNTSNDQAAKQILNFYVPLLNQQLNLGIRKNADGDALLNKAKSIEIQNGELVIQTQ